MFLLSLCFIHAHIAFLLFAFEFEFKENSLLIRLLKCGSIVLERNYDKVKQFSILMNMYDMLQKLISCRMTHERFLPGAEASRDISRIVTHKVVFQASSSFLLIVIYGTFVLKELEIVSVHVLG